MGARPELDRRPIHFGVFDLDPLSGELRKYGVRSGLVERSGSLGALLAAQPEWRKVYEDDLCLLLVRRTDGTDRAGPSGSRTNRSARSSPPALRRCGAQGQAIVALAGHRNRRHNPSRGCRLRLVARKANHLTSPGAAQRCHGC